MKTRFWELKQAAEGGALELYIYGDVVGKEFNWDTWRWTPSENSVGASMVFASPATMLSGPGMAAASRPITSCSTTPGTNMQSAPASRNTSAIAA